MSSYEEDAVDYNEDDGTGELYDEGVTGDSNEGAGHEDEVEPEKFKMRVLEMEEELEKLTKMQAQVEKQISSTSDKMDESSIYVGQVDYDASPEELRAHFAPCGTINRVTIMCDKITGHSKGFAYIEFVDKESVDNALKLDDSVFKGRQLKVLPKRQNAPTFVRGGGRGGFRGGGRGGTGPVFGAGRGAPAGGRAGGRGGYYAGGRGGVTQAPFGRGGGGAGRWGGGGRAGGAGAPGGGRGGYRGGGRAGYTPYY